MELTLSQITQNIDGLFDAIQHVIQGKQPIKLISPVALQNILRNVTLKLPEDYELIAGTSLENMHLYYDFAEVSVVANVHCLNLILSVPLKPENRQFTLFKTITLQIRISSDKYVQYLLDYTYLGLQHSQQAYILLTETGFNRCKKNTLTVCPADIAVYQAQALTCEISLYFQKSDNQHLCRRQLLLNHDTPFLHRHGAICLFHFPTRHQITLHCPGIDNRMPRNLFLEATGLLHNATTCHVTSSEIQLLPELHGVTGVKIDSPQLMIPDTVSNATELEIQQLKDITPAEIQKPDEIRSRFAAPRRTYGRQAAPPEAIPSARCRPAT